MTLARLSRQGMKTPARMAWLLVILAITAVFLFTDKSEDTECIHNVVIYDAAVLPHNCDALSMVDRLLRSDTFYTEFHNWKGRPVYHAYGMIAGNALVPLAFPLWAALAPGAEAKNQLRKFSVSFNFHLAYFLLNIAVVIGCVWIAIRIAGLNSASWPAIALAAAIASSDLVEGGVWLLHTNIFNLVSAFGTLLFIVLGMQRTLLTRRAVMAGGLAIGLGILIYPALAIMAPGYMAGRVIGRLRVANDRQPLAGELAEALMFLLAAALPVAAWLAANRFVFETGTYLTADRGHFGWLPAAWAEGRLWPTLSRQLVWYGRIVGEYSAAEYPLALGSIVLLTVRRGMAGVRTFAGDPVVWAVLIAMAGVLGFNFLQGYYEPRLHVAAAYLLYVAVARIARWEGSEMPATLCLFAIAAYQIGNALLTVSVSGN